MKSLALKLILVAGALHAADQVITIDTVPCVITEGVIEKLGVTARNATLTAEGVPETIRHIRACVNSKFGLLRDQLPEASEPSAAEKRKAAVEQYYIIHLVRYKDGQAAMDTSHWYVYHPSSPCQNTHFRQELNLSK